MRPQSTTAISSPSLSPRRELNTLRARHNEVVCRLAALPVPQSPCVYDSCPEVGHLLLDQIRYLRQVVDTVGAVFECTADDAADYAGAHVESFDLVRAASEDFVAPLTNAAELLLAGD